MSIEGRNCKEALTDAETKSDFLRTKAAGGCLLILIIKERLEEEKQALGEDIKEVYAEAKGTGFEPKIMRQILKIRKMDKDEHDEQESLLDIYKRALGMLPDAEATAQAAE